MALYRDIDFRTGSALDKLGANPTINGTNFRNAELGLAFEGGSSKYVTYDRQLLPDGAFSVVVWARLRYSYTSGNSSVISATNSGAYTSVIALTSDAFANKPAIGMSASNYKYWNAVTISKTWKCYIFTITGSAQADIANAALYINTVNQGGGISVSSGSPSTRTGFVYAGAGNTASGGAMIAKIKVYDTVIDTAQINREQEEFEQARSLTRQSICNYPMPNNTILDLYENWKYLGVGNSPVKRGEWIKTTGAYSVQHWVNITGNIISSDFTTTVSPWSPIRGTFVATGGVGVFTYTETSASEKRIQITNTTSIINKYYRIRFKAKSPTLASNFILTGYGDRVNISNPVLTTEWQNYEITGRCLGAGYHMIMFPDIGVTGEIVYIDDIIITEVQVKPNSFYLKCDTPGILSIPYSKVSGLWELELLKGADTNNILINLISNNINNITANSGISLVLTSNEAIRVNNTAMDIIIGSADTYIANNVWYKFRIYRLGNTPGTFPKRLKGDTVYPAWSILFTIQGGAFTNETVVVDSVRGNPVTFTTYQSSKFMIIDADANDLIGDIKHFNFWSL